jgi:hypothetical protein
MNLSVRRKKCMKNIFRKVIATLLLITLATFHAPQISFAQTSKSQSTAAIPMEYFSTPETNIESKVFPGNWWMIIIGLVVIGGVIALSGGGSDPPPPPPSGGTVGFTW